MHAGQDSLHYAPASVGALMDTAFLRHAVHDVQGASHPAAEMSPGRRPTWRIALRHMMVQLRARVSANG